MGHVSRLWDMWMRGVDETCGWEGHVSGWCEWDM